MIIKSSQTILIVDDAKANINLMVKLLKDYDIITAVDGESALETAAIEDIDLILLDIMMPIMNGFEVCNILKSNKKLLIFLLSF